MSGTGAPVEADKGTQVPASQMELGWPGPLYR
jgi:hypothetical protein